VLNTALEITISILHCYTYLHWCIIRGYKIPISLNNCHQEAHKKSHQIPKIIKLQVQSN